MLYHFQLTFTFTSSYFVPKRLKKQKQKHCQDFVKLEIVLFKSFFSGLFQVLLTILSRPFPPKTLKSTKLKLPQENVSVVLYAFFILVLCFILIIGITNQISVFYFSFGKPTTLLQHVLSSWVSQHSSIIVRCFLASLSINETENSGYLLEYSCRNLIKMKIKQTQLDKEERKIT